jgi:hypothetical protein
LVEHRSLQESKHRHYEPTPLKNLTNNNNNINNKKNT